MRNFHNIERTNVDKMINYQPNVGLMYLAYVVTVLIIKIFSGQKENFDLQENFRKSFQTDKIILMVLISLEVILIFLIDFKNKFILGFNIDTSSNLRNIGIVLGYLGTIFIILSLIKLGKVYTATLNIMNGHKLVQNGIYKYIRHPIYTGFILLHLGVTLALSNLIVTFVWIGGLCIFLWHRVPKEEELLEYYFKDEYKQYKARTGMFFPKILR